VRALIARHIEVTLITPPPSDEEMEDASAIHRTSGRVHSLPHVPLAGRRARPCSIGAPPIRCGDFAPGRARLELVRANQIDLVHGFGASVLGYARARRRGHAPAPLVLTPQGLEEFGATDPKRARLKRAAYLPLRRSVLLCAAAADAVIATDRALEPFVLHHLGIPRERMTTIPNALDLRALDALTDPTRSASSAFITRSRPASASCSASDDSRRARASTLLLRALAAVRDHGALEGRAWRWVVLGDGPYARCWRCSAARARAGAPRAIRLGAFVRSARCLAWHEMTTLFVHPTRFARAARLIGDGSRPWPHRRAVVRIGGGGHSRQGAAGTEWMAGGAGRSVRRSPPRIQRPRSRQPARLRALRPRRPFDPSSTSSRGPRSCDATVALYRRLLG
jgi:glycosyltransferase involved in cell wall biosynthesis